MSTFLRLIIMGVLILIGKTFAAERPASAADLDKLQEQVRTLENNVAIQKELTSARLEAQEKRLSDVSLTTTQQANHIAAVANQTSWISILVGLITVVIPIAAGFATYFNAKKAAKEEAEQEAKKWFDDHSAALRQEIDALQQHATNSRTKIDHAVAEVEAKAVQSNAKINEAANKVLSAAASSKADQTPFEVDEKTKQVLENANRELTQKPEAEFTAKDHYIRGMTHLGKSEYQSALQSIEAALEKAPNTPSYLFAKAVTLSNLKEYRKAIELWDEINSNYCSGNDTSSQIDKLLSIEEASHMRLLMAKEKWADTVTRNNLLNKASTDLIQFYTKNNTSSVASGNLGYLLFLLGKKEEAREKTTESLKHGGDNELTMRRVYTQQHRVEPQDSDYEALLTEVWEELFRRHN